MIVRSLKAKILVFGVFFIGIATGIVIANFYTTRVASAPDTSTSRAERAQRDMNKFYDYLGLNLAQREQMRKIGEETRREFRELREETQPKFDAIREASRIKVRALLNNEQLKKYEEFRKKIDERRKKEGGDFKVPPDFYRDGGGPRLD